MRYSGKIGYAVETEVSPGLFEDVIVERDRLGKVEQRTEKLDTLESALPQYRNTTSISVLVPPEDARLDDIRYVTYKGYRWTVSSIVHQPPRVTLFIGDRYNGPTPE